MELLWVEPFPTFDSLCDVVWFLNFYYFYCTNVSEKDCGVWAVIRLKWDKLT